MYGAFHFSKGSVLEQIAKGARDTFKGASATTPATASTASANATKDSPEPSARISVGPMPSATFAAKTAAKATVVNYTRKICNNLTIKPCLLWQSFSLITPATETQ